MRYIRFYNKQTKPLKWPYADPSRRILLAGEINAVYLFKSLPSTTIGPRSRTLRIHSRASPAPIRKS